METIAKTGKEVLKAMLWLYENRLDHLKCWFFAGKNDRSGRFQISFFHMMDACNGKHTTIDVANKLDSACLSGCLALIRTNDSTRKYARDLLIHEIGDSIPDWNDDPIRTKQDVIDLLRKLIDKK